jgi:hypothetical protein
MAGSVKMELFIKINDLTGKPRKARTPSHKPRIRYNAMKNQCVTATSHTSRRRIIRNFIFLPIAYIKKGVFTMLEPKRNDTWNYPFGTAALVFYLTEPLGDRIVDDICYHIRKLTINPIDSTSYFLLLFPDAASVLLFCPQRAICCGMGKGDLPPVLARARQKITETVLKLIGEQCS